ncbi:response regulator [uncultured Maricaulis sp.]|uniref:response regulator n=1 Tax=uncultured Maricaulis sp. TaxID=174710 RepID=UPI0026319B35|nr:response regulator [uncultured Maricaulis sp.]
MNAPRKGIEILHAEDNESDVFLTRMAFEDSDFRAQLHVAVDGEAALDFLFKRSGHEGAPTPDLILLDLNLPKLDGKQVLAQLKNAPDLRRIPVIILSSSRADQDITDSYDRHANGYITKPDEFGRMRDVVEAIEEFWFGAATLPARH